MSRCDFDVIVIGAGAAGLTATVRLQQAGFRVVCLEARDRVGGRIFTELKRGFPVPIELGAEFVHGSPPETLAIVERAGLTLCDAGSHMRSLQNGVWTDRNSNSGMWELLDRLKCYTGPDESFASYLGHVEASPEAKAAALRYVEGFNAAMADRISIASIRQDSLAAEAIDHGYQSRILGEGYAAVAHHLAAQIEHSDETLRLNHVVESVTWDPGSVAVMVHGREPIRGRAAIVTLPIGVLQAESVRFVPVPVVLAAVAPQIANGQVYRVALKFSERFWEAIDGLEDAGFLFSEEELFPTWWTTLPIRAPMLVGWSSGPHATKLIGRSETEIIAEAVKTLTRITGCNVQNVLRGHAMHDWHADPFSRGAYSYALAGHLDARSKLAEPVAKTLFFAGEATETDGHSATVHGAIRTGERAASQVRQALT